MKIGSATTNNYSSTNLTQPKTAHKEVVAAESKTSETAKVTSKNLKSEDYPDQVSKAQHEKVIDEPDLAKMIEKANKGKTGTYYNFEYSIHEETKKIMVKVIDRETKEIVREIPPEKVLDMVAYMWELAGVLIDERS